MTASPLIPDSAPFTAEQRAWLNGFLAGILGKESRAVPPPADDRLPLIVAFGSQSGNAESLARRIGRESAARGFEPRVAELDSVPPADLAAAGRALIVTSTWGDGEMPDNAAGFWEQLNRNGSSPSLAGLRYSVLALGDRNYGDTFCQAGRDLDRRLAELGAERIHACVECDVDYDEPAAAWIAAAMEAIREGSPDSQAAAASPAATPEPASAESWSRKNPFPAPLISATPLNGEGSAKDTRHVVFSLENSGLVYETGDALGVRPLNCPDVVEAVLALLPFDGSDEVPLPDGGRTSLRDALFREFEIRHLLTTPPPNAASAADFVAGLRKMQPRLYSIASSPLAHPGEVHLCVGVVRYECDGAQHKGVASTFLAERLPSGESAGVFVHAAKHFRLPEDRDAPVIMVGPGTGIAPFRAFLEHREATGADGRNWLFFGDRHAATDFLYREQLEAWHRGGLLTRLDTAFSRDQDEKIYVQTQMLRQARELWEWLEAGAFFYVCGDASRMARDVDAALHSIVQSEGKMTADAAAGYVAAMKKAKRYARDVY